MRSFTDNLGRSWSVVVNVASLKKVRGLLGFDVYKMLEREPQKFDELLSDPITLVDLLYVLCQDQAASQNVNDMDFGQALFGDAVEKAAEALVLELVDFFPNSRVRAGIKRLLETSKEVKTKALDEMEKRIASLTPESIMASLPAGPKQPSGS